MAGESYMVPPVERNLMPLVVRRSGAREYQQKEKNPREHSETRREEEKKAKNDVPLKVLGCLLSGNNIDCRI